MKFATLVSSVVDRAGYEPAEKRLSIILHNGQTYDICPCSAEEYAAFMAAPSQGVHWFRYFSARALATGGPVKLREPAQSTKHTWDEDASCCGKAIAKAALAGKLNTAESWTCPSCGNEWKPTEIGETMRHWSPVVAMMVFHI
jgi:hypothetical protein